MEFTDRAEAGRRLGERIAASGADQDAVVCGIPQGGAIVGAQAAIAARLPYECVVVCKIGMPCFPDVTLGAIDADGKVLFDPKSELTRHELGKVGDSLIRRLDAQVAACRGDRPAPEYEGKAVIVVDDVVETAIPAAKAVEYLRARGAAHTTLATPVISTAAKEDATSVFDDVIALQETGAIRSLSQFYGRAETPTDAEVHEHLAAAWAER